MVPSLLCTFVAHITFLYVFFLPPPFILSLSLSCFLFLSLSLSFSLSLFISPPSFSLWLQDTCHLMPFTNLYQIFSSWSILLFYTISFHSSYKIHQLFTDYLLRLPSSELLEKHLFRSRANRRLVDDGTSFRAKGWPFRGTSQPKERREKEGEKPWQMARKGGEREREWRCEDVKMRRCEEDEKMKRYEERERERERRRESEDGKMRRCDEHVNIWKCIADLHY